VVLIPTCEHLGPDALVRFKRRDRSSKAPPPWGVAFRCLGGGHFLFQFKSDPPWGGHFSGSLGGRVGGHLPGVTRGSLLCRGVTLSDSPTTRDLELAYEPSYGWIRACVLRALNFIMTMLEYDPKINFS
jgi:hypothetical protein